MLLNAALRGMIPLNAIWCYIKMHLEDNFIIYLGAGAKISAQYFEEKWNI